MDTLRVWLWASRSVSLCQWLTVAPGQPMSESFGERLTESLAEPRPVWLGQRLREPWTEPLSEPLAVSRPVWQRVWPGVPKGQCQTEPQSD